MKNKIIIVSLAVSSFLWGCREDVPELLSPVAPSNVSVTIDVEAGRTGNVTFSPVADNALSFQIFFGDGQDPAQVIPGNNIAHRYTRSGQYTVDATIVAFGTGGVSSSIIQSIDLDVRLLIDAETLGKIAGNGEKRWIWQSTAAGHFGVGPTDTQTPDFFSADANSLPADCLYDDVLVFSHDGNDNYSYELISNNTTYMNWAEVTTLFPEASPQEFVDECRDITGILPTQSSFIITTDDATGKQTLGLSGSFTSYFANILEFEIVELTDNLLSVRGIQFPPAGGELAWYFKFIPEDGGSGGGSMFNNLVWSDEFDVDGAPDGNNWGYDIGTGVNGWGNNEVQYYTDRLDNAVVENGILKIIAKSENFSGSQYTSARLLTKDKFEFTFGRVEVRAKLPSAGGTWPAIWTLGADFETNIWPAAGEIDIMEHVGNDPGIILGTTHSPCCFGGTANSGSTTVSDATSEFHVYSIVWDETSIQWFIDGSLFFTYNPAVKDDDTYPFNKDFFFILNVAMGGTLGGSIDPAFTEDMMEIDYIRVYQ